jgi:hypothetical protein
MLEVARDRAAPLIERAVVEHTAGCPACSRDLERERALTAGLRAVALHHSDRTPSSDLEARLLEAFASQRGAAERAPASAPAARVRGWLPLAAGLALCAAGLIWWIARPESVAPSPLVATVQRPAPAAPIQPATVADPPRVMPEPIQVRHRGRRRAPTPPVQAVGFIPIPSAAGLPDFESGQIVRLGIPVTALPNYGVEIPSGGESSIQADLLVGQDGQPRAIRLVNSSGQDLHQRR